MKTYLLLTGIITVFFISACSKGGSPAPSNNNNNGSGGTDTVAKVVDVVVLNGAGASYDSNGSPTYEFDSEWGTDIKMQSGTGAIKSIALINPGTMVVTTVQGGASVKISNVYKSSDNTLGDAANIKKILASNTYLKMLVDKATYKVDEYDFVFVDDGASGGFSCSFLGTDNIKATADVTAAFTLSNFNSIAFSLGAH